MQLHIFHLTIVAECYLILILSLFEFQPGSHLLLLVFQLLIRSDLCFPEQVLLDQLKSVFFKLDSLLHLSLQFQLIIVLFHFQLQILLLLKIFFFIQLVLVILLHPLKNYLLILHQLLPNLCSFKSEVAFQLVPLILQLLLHLSTVDLKLFQPHSFILCQIVYILIAGLYLLLH